MNEHTRAAGEFANAARNTSSVEALRTLKLLEQHHRRLSELLQLPNSAPTSQTPSENDSQASEKDESSPDGTSANPSSKSDPAGLSSEKNNNQPMPTLTKQPRYPTRDLGASIASNLASARGIRSKYRSQPLSPSVSNTEAPGNMETASRRSGPRTKMQNMLDNSDKPHSISSPERERVTRQNSQDGSSSRERGETQTNSSDEGFSRFYSAFGSIINRISAPLAFAGLPLISEDQAEEPPAPAPESSPAQKRSRTRVSPSATAEPDLKKIYSRAALRAVSRDGQSANDSFYVVPTSGHTASYASILTFADKEKRRMEASSAAQGASGILLHNNDNNHHLDDNDGFVDARESQVPRSPMLQRLASKGIRSDRELTNAVEELYLENKSLKDMLDKLSKRLHAFESMSQNSGMRLAESMRLMRPGSPLASTSAAASPGGGGGSSNNKPTDEALARKNRELEEQVLVMTKQMDEMEKSYNKARQNLIRYREKWEQLKAGAKARRAGGGSSSGGGGGVAHGVGSEMGTDDGMRSPSLA